MIKIKDCHPLTAPDKPDNNQENPRNKICLQCGRLFCDNCGWHSFPCLVETKIYNSFKKGFCRVECKKLYGYEHGQNKIIKRNWLLERLYNIWKIAF